MSNSQMAAPSVRRRSHRRHWKARWKARIVQREQEALKECASLLPIGFGWWLYFVAPAGSWAHRHAQLCAYERWKYSYLAWRQSIVDGLTRMMSCLEEAFRPLAQSLAALPTLLAPNQGEQSNVMTLPEGILVKPSSEGGTKPCHLLKSYQPTVTSAGAISMPAISQPMRSIT